MPQTPSPEALQAARAILEQWEVGTFSRFCDEPADFDTADVAEIAAVIDQVYASLWQEQIRLQEAIDSAVRDLAASADPFDRACNTLRVMLTQVRGRDAQARSDDQAPAGG